ncbi:MAG: hypothetical protein ACYC2P_06180 [Paludibacteraceae bacterium]
MKGRQKKISQDTLQSVDRQEAEGKLGRQTYMLITEKNFTIIPYGHSFII